MVLLWERWLVLGHRRERSHPICQPANGKPRKVALGARVLLGLCLCSVIWIGGGVAWAGGGRAIATTGEALPISTPSTGETMPAAQSGRLDISAISSEKVSQFIEAYQQVLSLIDEQEEALRGAETEADFLQRQGDLERKIATAIDAVGLSQQEYIQLLGLANSDPEFSERIASQLQEAGEP
ncbi:MAG: DUF4168 domain-containing protein [Synechococcales bacterium]|nr:DUF4168 domain-containing protein [Synechococcales bacterium]